jgi:uncharacterized protein YodC (DUF2158 family)
MIMNTYNLIEKQIDPLFFSPGDVVTLKQEISNKPIMIVKTIDRASSSVMDDKPKLVGVTCMWFNAHQDLQTARFSTKDLQHHGEQSNGQ